MPIMTSLGPTSEALFSGFLGLFISPSFGIGDYYSEFNRLRLYLDVLPDEALLLIMEALSYFPSLLRLIKSM